eukprot:gnl/MRDRNA2_/MRDRNA2_190766_c0_seq1.p1 gnl/MRDRNA2_/MRDRNA2_190766_c0~~gnl/MRDRNA2_/MRDRNA2_190766_c0_seq1.p1  ORF type:complete len:594 (+),score=94.76 gnl/MRDRNA2_/MRDRNA2_190766_c0_seq1:38-1783(+)
MDHNAWLVERALKVWPLRRMNLDSVAILKAGDKPIVEHCACKGCFKCCEDSATMRRLQLQPRRTGRLHDSGNNGAHQGSLDPGEYQLNGHENIEGYPGDYDNVSPSGGSENPRDDMQVRHRSPVRGGYDRRAHDGDYGSIYNQGEQQGPDHVEYQGPDQVEYDDCGYSHGANHDTQGEWDGTGDGHGQGEGYGPQEGHGQGEGYGPQEGQGQGDAAGYYYQEVHDQGDQAQSECWQEGADNGSYEATHYPDGSRVGSFLGSYRDLPKGTGVLFRWNSEKNYGWIKPDDGSKEIFCHANDLMNGEGSVKQGDPVIYILKFDDKVGKYKAVKVHVNEHANKPYHLRPKLKAARRSGVVRTWKEEKGYGFIVQDDGSPDIFCHARCLVDGEGSVAEGDPVSYILQYNKGREKWEAASVFKDEEAIKAAAANAWQQPGNPMQALGGGMHQGHPRGWQMMPGNGPQTWNNGGAVTKSHTEGESATGVIKFWNSAKHFGFICPSYGGDDIFYHAGGLVNGDGSVKQGDAVSYNTRFNSQHGRWEAVDVRVAYLSKHVFRRTLPQEGARRGVFDRLNLVGLTPCQPQE